MEQENLLQFALAVAVSYLAERGMANEWKQSKRITSTAYVRWVMTLLQGDAILAYPINLGMVSLRVE